MDGVRPVKVWLRADAPPAAVVHAPSPIRTCQPVAASPVVAGVQVMAMLVCAGVADTTGAPGARAVVVAVTEPAAVCPVGMTPRTLTV